MMMNFRYTFLATALALVFTTGLKAQTYMPKVSKDSLGILEDRIAVLKATLKLHELKVKEAEEEKDVEKLRIKLIKANADSKESASKNDDLSKKFGTGTLDAKAIQKIAKRAKDDMNDAQKALDSYDKQKKRVEDIRSEIRVEEEKLLGMKPLVSFITHR
ncbi:hypothetical protein [Pedobacter insulae]|uniref:Uncharacterized protein n=1 Tax=Pedobacter insulae TaxID=414048 RepID=A0A1I2ZSJ2_9SPHI|nr:hypothetical protein [Pedobacter insulae]SFH40670.1 hypothetical protein SAMN04489864_11158 [Pedobacter insulae]